jgi:hypothetical protein
VIFVDTIRGPQPVDILGFLRASAAVSSISKSSVVISAAGLGFCQNSNPRLLEFEDKTSSSDKSFLLYYLLLNQERRRRHIVHRRRKNSAKYLKPSPPSTIVSSIKSICEFDFKSAGHSTLCVLQYFCSDYLVYKKRKKQKAVTTNKTNQISECANKTN